jgi:transcription initiation factor TFIID subunit 6
MSIVPKETIEVIAQSVGIPTLPADVSAALAPDVEYRLREIMQVRRPFFPFPLCLLSN